MIKRILVVLLLVSGLQSSWAFSLAGPVGNGEIEGSIVVVVLLERTLRIGVVQRFHDFERCIVVGRVVERQIAVVVFLSGAFRKDFEKEFFHIQGTFLPSGKVQSQVSIIIGYGGSFRVGFQQSF